MPRNAASIAIAFIAALATPESRAQMVPDPIYAAGFEAADVPATDGEAARFLTQASFGPTKADIAHVRNVGYGAWIDEQLAMPATLAEPYLTSLTVPNGLGQGNRMDRWFNTAAVGPDQLRQRVAFALSQIMVISDVTLEGTVDLANYWDLLAKDSFGSYRTLLQDVTLSEQMGHYLSHFRNQKASGTVSPDENYAREVMQLFSIGLEFRNADFSLVLDGNNHPIPTYDQNVVLEMAQVFTGFSYPCTLPACNTYNGLFSAPKTFLPMACFARYHDLSSKQLFALTSNGPTVILPAMPVPQEGSACPTSPTPQQALACLDYCNNDLKGALDALGGHSGVSPFDGHSNVPPFVSRQLIQRFVTSNPSPAYIQRVATAFTDSGGSLGQTIRAILLDGEARNAPSDSSFGKPREPILKVVAMWRAWDAQMKPDTPATGVPMGITSPQTSYLERPLGAPTVFNFFEPDYQQPGPVADAGLYSPELQIVNESSVASAGNNLYTFSWNGYVGYGGGTSGPLLDLAPLTTLSDNATMVSEANLRMLYGSMSLSMRATLLNLLNNNMPGSTATQRALALIHLIALSPEFATQR